MSLEECLKDVAVIGAAGKMGSGISLLILQEMARLEARLSGKMGSGKFRLKLIDANSTGLGGLKAYLRGQLQRYAERHIIALRKDFAGNKALVDNEEIIRHFVQGAMDLIDAGTMVEEAKDSKLIFEAIVEDVEVKGKVFKAIDALNKLHPYYFTNTSSIPISLLSERSGVGNRIIGFHFYNPPAVQKLVEIIPMDQRDPELFEMAQELAKRLEKIFVASKDVAGFIGNGYFLREILFACSKVNALAGRFTPEEAIYLVNRVTQEYLVRPMGTFQLLDYVGIDVCQKIGKIMNTCLKQEVYQDDLIGSMVEAGITGGQFSDGSQKDGFFQYKDHRIAGLYIAKEGKYRPLGEGGWAAKCDNDLGALPKGYVPWKQLQKDPGKEEKLRTYFEHLYQENTLGAELARSFLERSAGIARRLVDEGVAGSMDDVDCVMKNGFFHLYGPGEIPEFMEKS